jgi:hypothetical protein
MALTKLFLTLAAIVLAGGEADVLLQSPSPGPCGESPDYVPGVDATGSLVPRADLGADKVPSTGSIMVPLRQGGQGQPGRGGQDQHHAHITLDDAKVEKLANPVPCHN